MQRIVRRGETGREAAEPLELFYDLVFAFTITQVSHLLIGNLGWLGAIQAGIVLLAGWWSWNYTTWFTDELDGDAVPVRLLLLGLMALSLLLSIAIPDAFGDRGILFAVTYVAIQLGRHGFLAFVAAGRGTHERERALNITAWFAAAAVFWIGGAFVEGRARIGVWGIALLIDYAAPRLLYRVPGRRRLGGEAWHVNPAHFTDRFACFIILTLGETIAITGATMTAEDLTVPRVGAFVISFFGSAAFWWLYFSPTWDGETLLARIDSQTVVARDVFTYGHLLLVAGILLAAVGDEFVLDHPLDALPVGELLPVVLGPVIFVLALGMIAFRIEHTVPTRYLAGAVGMAVLGVAAWMLGWQAVLVSGAMLLVLATLVVIAIHGQVMNPVQEADAR